MAKLNASGWRVDKPSVPKPDRRSPPTSKRAKIISPEVPLNRRIPAAVMVPSAVMLSAASVEGPADGVRQAPPLKPGSSVRPSLSMRQTVAASFVGDDAKTIFPAASTASAEIG